MYRGAIRYGSVLPARPDQRNSPSERAESFHSPPQARAVRNWVSQTRTESQTSLHVDRAELRLQRGARATVPAAAAAAPRKSNLRSDRFARAPLRPGLKARGRAAQAGKVRRTTNRPVNPHPREEI